MDYENMSNLVDPLSSGDSESEIEFARMLRDNADIVIRDIRRVAAGRPDLGETWLEDVEFPVSIELRISTPSPEPSDPEVVGESPKRHRTTGNRGNGSPSTAVDRSLDHLSTSVGDASGRLVALPPGQSSQARTDNRWPKNGDGKKSEKSAKRVLRRQAEQREIARTNRELARRIRNAKTTVPQIDGKT